MRFILILASFLLFHQVFGGGQPRRCLALGNEFDKKLSAVKFLRSHLLEFDSELFSEDQEVQRAAFSRYVTDNDYSRADGNFMTHVEYAREVSVLGKPKEGFVYLFRSELGIFKEISLEFHVIGNLHFSSFLDVASLYLPYESRLTYVYEVPKGYLRGGPFNEIKVLNNFLTNSEGNSLSLFDCCFRGRLFVEENWREKLLRGESRREIGFEERLSRQNDLILELPYYGFESVSLYDKRTNERVYFYQK